MVNGNPRVLATWGPNSQNSPRFLEFIEKKNGKSPLKIRFGNLGSIPLEGQILSFSRIHSENILL